MWVSSFLNLRIQLLGAAEWKEATHLIFGNTNWLGGTDRADIVRVRKSFDRPAFARYDCYALLGSRNSRNGRLLKQKVQDVHEWAFDQEHDRHAREHC